MEEGDGGSGDGYEECHHNKSFSSVPKEGFSSEEDEDYDNQVDVDEEFFQILNICDEELGFVKEEDMMVNCGEKSVKIEKNVARMGDGGVNVNNGGDGNGSMVFVGELQWWTKDAELEAELCKYGAVKEVKIFADKSSGISKGYCEVRFCDSAAAMACMKGMNGHKFDGKPCVVAYASSSENVRKMGELQMARSETNPAQNRKGKWVANVGRVGGNKSAAAAAAGGNCQGQMVGRGQAPIGNGMVGMGGQWGVMGNGFLQYPLVMPDYSMMGQGFGYGAYTGIMSGYGVFPAVATPTPPFAGMMPLLTPVGGVGLPGVDIYLNPDLFGSGMPSDGMGMMLNNGKEGNVMGMCPDPSAAGSGGKEPLCKAGKSSYKDVVVSDHQYGDGSNGRGEKSKSTKKKDKYSEQNLSGVSNRKDQDDNDPRYDHNSEMLSNGTGMITNNGNKEGPVMGMLSDPSAAGRPSEVPASRGRESSLQGRCCITPSIW